MGKNSWQNIKWSHILPKNVQNKFSLFSSPKIEATKSSPLTVCHGMIVTHFKRARERPCPALSLDGCAAAFSLSGVYNNKLNFTPAFEECFWGVCFSFSPPVYIYLCRRRPSFYQLVEIGTFSAHGAYSLSQCWRGQLSNSREREREREFGNSM